ncbi:putative phage tail protein [Pelosinus propionicus]|uniref:Uncharacterized protein n=1 Tax=Pelosinus propionicus DSM 13327 TaxID=1123291 RepID=A0A1I4QKZ1_9FIRM|nr:putative phage tail protein [Pelosinus propionicus]SFM40729.1 hypothetical protein SAMN04490355_11094 [Pelosinus propionicus DSM 13327]
MAHDLKDYLPDYYDDITDTDALMDAEQPDIDTLWSNISTMDNADPDSLANRGVMDNQFIQTSDSGKLTKLEALFGILADTTTETLAFRRTRLLNRFSQHPPFTVPWLTQQLDNLIGAGLYTLTIDHGNYTIYLASSAQNQSYYTEVVATIAYVKPCNMIFVNQPLVPHGLYVNESVSLGEYVYNYHLGTSWILGQKPFLSFSDGGIIVVAASGSVQPGLLADVAAFTATDIVKVRINGSVLITIFEIKTSSAAVTTVEYDVTPTQASTITLVELLNSSNVVLTSSTVYVPVPLGVRMTHTITFKEGS